MFLHLFSLLFFISCNQDIQEKFSEIKVGMTYEEVEKLLNKPISINRGVNELFYDVTNLSYDSLKQLNWDTTDIKIVRERWIVPNSIRTIGQLIYVNWVFDISKKDTFFVVINKFKQIYDTTYNKIPFYYLGNRKVSKTEYDKLDGYEYWLDNNGYVDKGQYYTYKNSGFFKNLREPKKVKKHIEYATNSLIKEHEEKYGIVKVYYEVDNKYCVIFDSSSGRVTSSGYYPCMVYKL